VGDETPKKPADGTRRARPSARRAQPTVPPPQASVAHDDDLGHDGPSHATEADEAEADAAVEAALEARHLGDDEPGAVLVTGICGRLGKLLVRRLHRTERVVGIDRRRFPDKPKDVIHYQVDVRRKKTRDVFRTERVSAVVHLGVLHDPRVGERERHDWNIVAFQKLLDYIVEYDVKKLVVLSSAAVYGPHADNPQFLAEDAPLLGAQGFGAIRDLIELDMLAQSFFWRHPDTETVILRPCHILGGVRNAASNYLRLERPLTVLGFDPMMQAIHENDVVRAIEHALRPGAKGIFNLRGAGELPLSKIFRKLGTTPIPIPGALATSMLDRLFRYHLSSFPAPELDHLRYICMVDDTRARCWGSLPPTTSSRPSSRQSPQRRRGTPVGAPHLPPSYARSRAGVHSRLRPASRPSRTVCQPGVRASPARRRALSPQRRRGTPAGAPHLPPSGYPRVSGRSRSRSCGRSSSPPPPGSPSPRTRCCRSRAGRRRGPRSCRTARRTSGRW
jgi:UDP-glucose 4-epimerase